MKAETLMWVWGACAVLNTYSVAYNSARDKDYSPIMFVALFLGIAFAPLMTIIGFATAMADRNT